MHARPFIDRVPNPVEHFRLSFFGAVLRLVGNLGTFDAACELFPFLAGYRAEFSKFGLGDAPAATAAKWWTEEVRAWERTTAAHLPLRAVRDAAALHPDAEAILLAVGLVEEDVRFGLVFEELQGMPGQRRPTLALLVGWGADAGRTRSHLARLIDLGLLQVANPEAPRLERAVQVHAAVWDALRGEVPESPVPGSRFRPLNELLPLGELILPGPERAAIAGLPPLIASGGVRTIVVRGPRGGRRTTLGAVARELGCGMLELHGPPKADDPHWAEVGPLAAAANAVPVIVLDLHPGEVAELPRFAGYDGPVGVVIGRTGGIGGTGCDRAITVALDAPDRTARRAHWHAALGGGAADYDDLARGVRVGGGLIRRLASAAQAQAALAGRRTVNLADARVAARSSNRHALDALAVRLEPRGTWDDLAVAADTVRDLCELESRCRHREALPGYVGAALGARLGPGIRALFTGPSGTGKTLAASLLAAALGADLYRLDLSSLVSKYIGETEKNLHRALTLAEELDVMLLLDEGDALLGPRTGVQSSNDRYANLETNFLLQRLESFDGILLITTNAAERIDSAFLRRMDAVVEFRAPDPAERWAIWGTHLPAGHAVDAGLLREVASRCPLTGGQIRNAVLHAAVLAASNGGVIVTEYVEDAVRREYRKAGAMCPLRAPSPSFA